MPPITLPYSVTLDIIENFFLKRKKASLALYNIWSERADGARLWSDQVVPASGTRLDGYTLN